ncbi:hypothetical protein ES703_12514 [subsurface metagenome]
MIIDIHTPDGVTQKELTPQQVQQLADDGDSRARIEIAQAEMSTHSDPHKKIDFLAWVLGITDTKPLP